MKRSKIVREKIGSKQTAKQTKKKANGKSEYGLFSNKGGGIKDVLKVTSSGDLIIYIDALKGKPITLMSKVEDKSVTLRWYEYGLVDFVCYGQIGVYPVAGNRAVLKISEKERVVT